MTQLNANPVSEHKATQPSANHPAYNPCTWLKKSVQWLKSDEVSFAKKAAVVSALTVTTAVILGLAFDKYTNSRAFANLMMTNLTRAKVATSIAAANGKTRAIFAANKLAHLKGKVDLTNNKQRAIIGTVVVSLAILAAFFLRKPPKKQPVVVAQKETQNSQENPQEAVAEEKRFGETTIQYYSNMIMSNTGYEPVEFTKNVFSRLTSSYQDINWPLNYQETSVENTQQGSKKAKYFDAQEDWN